MNLLFINLGKTELAAVLLFVLATVFYAVFRVLKNDQLTKILWVLLCLFIPLLSLIYILYDTVVVRKKRDEFKPTRQGTL